MLRREPPLHWRTGFSLYRRRLVKDSSGETEAVYDMEHPDFTAQDCTQQGVCWQSVQSWQSSGRITSGWKPGRQGEAVSGVVEGRLFYPLQVRPFDRIAINGQLYEVRSVQRWPGHRKLLLQQIG
jgi:hypothetical protein